MTKLNQIIAVTNGKKSKVQSALTKAYHTLQKAEPFQGINRVYVPNDEEGETLPPESKLPQNSVKDEIKNVGSELKELFECVYTQEYANCSACADVKINGDTILAKVPVTYLLFLEKKLVDIHTFVSKLPTLPADREWTFDANKGCYVTDVTRTSRTKKVRKSFVAYEATAQHPAQVEVFTEDEIVGTWAKTDFSTCIPATEKAKMLERVVKLQEAVKFAREEANTALVETKKADSVIDFIFGT